MKRFFLILLLWCAPQVWGQALQNDSITLLEEVTLVEAPSKKATGITASSVLSSKALERFDPTAIAPALNQISGVYLLSGALNTNRITIRGVGARTPYGTDKLRLYFDGIPVTNGTGFSTLETFDVENLGAVEVIKGPKGTAFGANLGGALILETQPPKKNTTQGTDRVTVGSYSLLKQHLLLQHAGEHYSLSLAYNHLETEGYRENNRFNRDGVLLHATLPLNTKSRLGILLNYVDYMAQIPSSINQTDFEEDPTRAASHWLAAQGFEANAYVLGGLSHTYSFSEHFRNTTSLFYTYLDHYEARPFNILDERTNGFGLRSHFEGRLGESTFTLGTELYSDVYHWSTFENLYAEYPGEGSRQGERLSRNREFRKQYALFGTLTCPLTGSLTAQLGLTLNKTRYDFRDVFNEGAENRSAQRDFDAILLPSLGLQYRFTHGKLYANISRGFSNPGLEETLTPEGVINPDIAQETGINYELGSQLVLFQEKLSVHIAVYRMDIANLLVAQRVGEDQFIGKNAGKTQHQGLEMEVQYALRLSKHLRVVPYLSYTLSDHRFVDFVEGDEDFSGNPLPGVPKHRLHSGIDVQHDKGLRVNITQQFVDEIPLTDANTLSSAAFTLFAAQLGYHTALSSRFSLGLRIGVNNVFDTPYAQSVLINAVGFGGSQPRYFYPGNGRNFYGGVQLGYRFHRK